MELGQIKQNNESYLASVGIKVPSHLPQIEELEEVKPRTAQEVASRLSAIAYVIGLGFGAKGEELKSYLEEFKLMNYVSDYELTLLNSDEISDQDKINMTWLSESAQALAWTIGLVELNNFTHCDDDLATKIPFKQNPVEFINNAKLRPISEIQEQADLLYRMHWYTRECQLTGKECELSNGIIMERRKAIDWVYGVEEDWDEVPMDT